MLAGLVLAGLALAAVIPAPARGDSLYPDHPVMLIVPYAPGGVADLGMRILGDKLAARLNQQFVIENRPGAGGIVAAQGRARPRRPTATRS